MIDSSPRINCNNVSQAPDEEHYKTDDDWENRYEPANATALYTTFGSSFGGFFVSEVNTVDGFMKNESTMRKVGLGRTRGTHKV